MVANNNRQNSEQAGGAQRASLEQRIKRAYAKPTLTEFGNVVDLTRGSAGSLFDGPTSRGAG